ncbi:MAG: flagellar hook-basal body complex protein [Gemmataceae bacterium]|nr:flagellar hook-basal body complex protein [Gemmataceae bacterium]
MSIFNALTNAVTGLQAQSAALGNISSNVANAQTVGYKRVDTGFADMVSTAPLRQQNGGSVAAFSRGTNGVAGTLTETRVPTHFGLSGDGFIAVRERIESSAAEPAFSASTLFTRRGDFTLDRSGYLVNGAGQYLVGHPLDPATGSVIGGRPEVIKVAAGRMPAQETTSLSFTGNVPARPATSRAVSGDPGSDVWTEAGGTPPATVSPTTIPSAATLATNSIAGPSVTLFDTRGNPVDVSFRWTKTQEDGSGSTWGLYAQTAPADAVDLAGWTRAATVTFDAAGRMTSPAGRVGVDLSSRGLASSVSLDLVGKVTQFADASGEMKLDRIEQNGAAMGDFDNLYVSDDGRIMARYTNGLARGLAQIGVARFRAPEMLERGSGGTFAATIDSGDPLWGAGTTSIKSGSLEGSNTDIAEEFSKMIVTQQAYAANTRVISTSQQMLQDTLNVVR